MIIPLPRGDFRAYLFDCDGTVADSMPVHYRAWSRAVGEWGGEFAEDLFHAWGGRPVADILADLNERQGLAMPVAEVARRREELYRELLPEVGLLPGILPHVEHAHRELRSAVVSGSTRESVQASLTALGVADRFETLVCAEDVSRPKPDPEGFLLAARRLGVAPEHCLVFEDSALGLRAAAAAGMAAVDVLAGRAG
ncbi:HAD family hydrolase [Kitasatospora sp. NPDC096147]|uniref:HAD family hydrolase n=1 Tax=Kitasatospora sp. NPDC096147 TaxID=3364093 RepID=UPI00382553AF